MAKLINLATLVGQRQVKEELLRLESNLNHEITAAMLSKGKVIKDKLASTSPYNPENILGNHLKDSWGIRSGHDKRGYGVKIYSRPSFGRWSLTHLLDQGHESFNQWGGPYGFVKGTNFFSKVLESESKALFKEVEVIIDRNINK